MADDDGTNDAGNTGGTDNQDNQQQDGGQDSGRQDTGRQEHEDTVRQEAEDKGKQLTQTEVDKIVADRVARERKKFADYDALKKKAGEYDKLQDGQKTEAQKLREQLDSQAVELQRLQVAEIRRGAASAAGLDPDLAEFITAADAEEAAEQAKKLAERLGSNKRPVDLRQGTRSNPPPQRSRDELLRGLAGYGN